MKTALTVLMALCWLFTLNPLSAHAAPPVADAGPDQTVSAGDTVYLDGSGSYDPDGDTLLYYWSQLSGFHITFDPSSVNPSFVAPIRCPSYTIEIRLYVVEDDPDGDLVFDDVQITVEYPGQPPVTDAGNDQTAAPSSQVTLDGSQSYDPDSGPDPLTFYWEQASGPTVSLAAPFNVSVTFDAPSTPVDLEFTLYSLDGDCVTSDNVMVYVRDPNNPPVPDAGDDQMVPTSSNVTLDASQSFDPDGDTLEYMWEQVGGPSVNLDSIWSLSPAAAFKAPPYPCELEFEVHVSDGQAEETDSVLISVEHVLPIPTLGAWGLMLLAALTALFAWAAVRRRNSRHSG